MKVIESAKKAYEASLLLAAFSSEKKNAALSEICGAIEKNADAIAQANKRDLWRGEIEGLAVPLKKRLLFDEKKIAASAEGIRALISLKDPCGELLEQRELAPGLTLRKTSCPIGVIGVIFESRPDALVQIACLCIKSGNAVLLKGGREAVETNRILADTIYSAGAAAGLPDGFITLLESREEVGQLLSCDEYVDLIIPRGSNEFVRYIMDNSKIPVMGHADGVCHLYVDSMADMRKAIRIAVDSKTQYPAACNAAETLLIARSAAPKLLPVIAAALSDKGVKLKGCAESIALIGCEAAGESDWGKEYLSLTMAVKVVADVKEAAAHINRYGSGHTDCIVTEDEAAAKYFMDTVDSAGVYQNCSTRFADGYRYGFGAEVGISTSKLHARGPVGLKGLVSYKYRLTGNGQTVDDFESGREAYTHIEKDLK